MFYLHFDQWIDSLSRGDKSCDMWGHMSKLAYAIGSVNKTPII